MALIFANRVLETSTTTGTGTYTLAGAVTGFQTFAAVGNSNTCYYYAEEVDGSGIPSGGWEVGLGTYTTSGTTLARTAILASSNSNNAVSWSAGTRRIAVTASANLFNPPSVQALNAAAQTIADGGTIVAFGDTDGWDTDAMHNPASDNTKVFINTAGVYLVTAAGTLAPHTSSTGCYISVFIGATEYFLNFVPSNSSAASALNGAKQFKLAVADEVRVKLYQLSGGNVNATNCSMEVTRIAVG